MNPMNPSQILCFSPYADPNITFSYGGGYAVPTGYVPSMNEINKYY